MQKTANSAKIFYGIFSLLFGNCERRFIIFEITTFLFGCSVECNAFFFSSGAASGAVSSKLDAEVPKVAEKDAQRYVKTFFVSFVLKHADKEKKKLQAVPVCDDLFFCLRSHKTLSKWHCCLWFATAFSHQLQAFSRLFRHLRSRSKIRGNTGYNCFVLNTCQTKTAHYWKSYRLLVNSQFY